MMQVVLRREIGPKQSLHNLELLVVVNGGTGRAANLQSRQNLDVRRNEQNVPG
jgi:hypothetical protein